MGTGQRIRLRGQKQGSTARETEEGQGKPAAGVIGEGTVGPAQRDRAEV